MKRLSIAFVVVLAVAGGVLAALAWFVAEFVGVGP